MKKRGRSVLFTNAFYLLTLTGRIYGHKFCKFLDSLLLSVRWVIVFKSLPILYKQKAITRGCDGYIESFVCEIDRSQSKHIYQRLPYVLVFFGKTMCTNLVLYEIIDIFAELKELNYGRCKQ